MIGMTDAEAERLVHVLMAVARVRPLHPHELDELHEAHVYLFARLRETTEADTSYATATASIREWKARAEAAEAECSAMRALIVPGLRVYKGDYVMQIDAGKVGLFTERYADEADLPRAIRDAQDRAIAARTKEETK